MKSHTLSNLHRKMWGKYVGKTFKKEYESEEKFNVLLQDHTVHKAPPKTTAS